jgi:hypothetical protein
VAHHPRLLVDGEGDRAPDGPDRTPKDCTTPPSGVSTVNDFMRSLPRPPPNAVRSESLAMKKRRNHARSHRLLHLSSSSGGR